MALVKADLKAEVLEYLTRVQASGGTGSEEEYGNAMADAVERYMTTVDLGTFGELATSNGTTVAVTAGLVTPVAPVTFENFRSGLISDLSNNRSKTLGSPSWENTYAGWVSDIALIVSVTDTGGYVSGGSTVAGPLDLDFFSTRDDTRSIEDVAEDFSESVYVASLASVFSGSPPANPGGFAATDAVTLTLI